MRGIVAGGPRDASAGMGTRAAQVESLKRHAVICCTNHRTGAEQLVEAHLAVKNVTADEAKAAFEIKR
jgi:hypothetical protein